MPKKILFVINTLGCGGAERALLELLKRLDHPDLDISLYVMTSQGELLNQLPLYVKLWNSHFNTNSVLSFKGRWSLSQRVIQAFFRNGKLFKKSKDSIKIFFSLQKSHKFQVDKMLWRMLSDGSQIINENFDLAISWIEGASTYYVADHIKANEKLAFIHIDYDRAGYTLTMDQGCWDHFNRIFIVSNEAKNRFLAMYPQYLNKVEIFHNLIDQKAILKASQETGFEDDYEGLRLLSVGRLTPQKAIDVAIDAMKILKDKGYPVRWYVLGEGKERKKLERKIASLKLQEDFFLLGTVENPYPYYAQADIYIHPSRFEGKSIAIQEAQILGCPIIASSCSSNLEQIENGKDGLLCELTPQALADTIEILILDVKKKEQLQKAAQKKSKVHDELVETLLTFLYE